MSNPNPTAPALRPLPRRVFATLIGFAAPVAPPRPERVAALAARISARALAEYEATRSYADERLLRRQREHGLAIVGAYGSVQLIEAAVRAVMPGRYEGADAAGDAPCVVVDGLDDAFLARYRAAGADVLAEVAS